MSTAEVQQRVDAWLRAAGWYAEGISKRGHLAHLWRDVGSRHGAASWPAIGVLIAIVREAWGDPTIVMSCRPGHDADPFWSAMRWDGTSMRSLLIYIFPTEVIALVAALEAAP